MRSLLYEYFRLLGIESEDPTIFKHGGDEPDPGEVEDAFGEHYDENLPMYRRRVDAFSFPISTRKEGCI